MTSFLGPVACFSRSYCISRLPRELERVSVRSEEKISLVPRAFSGEPRVLMRKFSFATTSFFYGMNTFSLRCLCMQLVLLEPSFAVRFSNTTTCCPFLRPLSWATRMRAEFFLLCEALVAIEGDGLWP